VPRHVARLITRIVAWLVVDYFTYAARLGASAHRAAHRLSSTTSPMPRVRVPRHVAWLITRLIMPLVVVYYASRRLIVDYFASAARPGASSSTTSPPPRVWVPRHVARLVTWLIARLVAPLVVDYSASHRLVVDYFASAARPGASARRAAHHTARCRLLRVPRLRLAATPALLQPRSVG
jgi:hypothetical protein